jgi:hypothetical protein
MAEMFTSASDITSNPGNAALGYSGGVGYSTNPADTNPGAPIQSVLGQIAQTEERKRIAEKARQQKEQDDLAAYLASTGESVFNMKGPDGKSSGFTMLPQDREYVNERVNEIRNKVVSEPGTYKFDAELKSKEQELKQLTDLAGIRATEVAKRKVLAAGTNDILERERILKSIQDIEKEPVYSFKTPDAYLPAPTWTIEGLGVDKDILTGKNKEATDILQVGTEIDKNGNEIAILRPGIRASVLDVRNKIRKGSPEYAVAANMVKALYSDPSALTKEAMLQLNYDISDYNSARGLTPEDANYAPPIAKFYGDDSFEMPELNDESIRNISYGLLAQRAGQLGMGKEIKKLKSDLDKEREATRVASGYLNLARVKQKQEGDKITKEDRAEEGKKREAMSDALGIYELISQPTVKALDEVISSVKEGERSGLNKIIQEMGGSTKDYNVRILPVSDGTIKNIAAIRGNSLKGEPNKIISKPQYAYLLVPKSGDKSAARFVFGYKILKPVVDDETGEIVKDKKTEYKLPKMQEVMEWKVQSPQEALKAKSMASNNFDDKTAQLIERDARGEEELRAMLSQGAAPSAPSPQKQPSAPSGNKTVYPLTIDQIPATDLVQKDGNLYLKVNGVLKKVIQRTKKNRLILEE